MVEGSGHVFFFVWGTSGQIKVSAAGAADVLGLDADRVYQVRVTATDAYVGVRPTRTWGCGSTFPTLTGYPHRITGCVHRECSMRKLMFRWFCNLFVRKCDWRPRVQSCPCNETHWK